MDSARHVIKTILNPRFLSQMASYDVASTIHESLQVGQVSYRSYWSRVVLGVLHQHKGSISIRDISAQTALREPDIVSALQSLNLLKYWKAGTAG